MENKIIRCNFDLMNTETPLIIAVDGYSSTGKSSISKVIAAHLGLIHIDTGAMYRAITLFALRNYSDAHHQIDMPNLLSHLDQIELEFRQGKEHLEIYLNDENVSREIRETYISEKVSEVAKQSEVRELLVKLQRRIGEKNGVVMDGRDIGTVVFPNADYKFFLTATADERARRRTLELQNMGIVADYEEVKKNLIERDKIDSERAVSPLIQAEDAILIDNTHLNKEETIDLILSHIKKK